MLLNHQKQVILPLKFAVVKKQLLVLLGRLLHNLG